jgi:hypothetical protein
VDLTHRFRDCSCPGTPHSNGDTVTYPKALPFDVLARVIGAIWDRDGAEPNVRNAFSIYLFEAPASWNLVDDKGDEIPLSREALEALDFADQYEIADYADTLYRDTVLSPFLRRVTSASSESGPTAAPSRPRTRS